MVRLVRVVRVRVESRAVRVEEGEGLRDGGHEVVGHRHREVRLDDDSKHGGRRVRVVEEVVRLFRDGVLHVHLVAADVPVLLRDGVLEVDVVVGRVQGRVDARRDLRVTMSSHRADTVDSGGDHRQALRVAGI